LHAHRVLSLLLFLSDCTHHYRPLHRQVQVHGLSSTLVHADTQGRDAKGRIGMLVDVLDRYTPDVLASFFEDDAWK
jgi:hypothetical protein